ncbi:MAG: hypothetical protein DME07_12485 [Candidatus Rokuibacteriota bacterium]|nr:MAG: hypothetical protein DME07_12485 [Candidatus Rokubacteria bacterium]
MAREWTILAAIGTVLIFSGSPATASVSNSGSDARAVTAAGPVSGAERSGLDELLERSGLRVQLEGLAAGVRVQFLRGQGRISSQDRATIDRIASTNFDADAIYSRIKLEFERNLDAEKLAGALAWYRSPLGKRITALELMALAFEKGWDSAVSIERKQASLQRIALVERLDASGGASETTVDVTLSIVRSLTRAFQPVLPASARVSNAQLEDQIATARSRTLEQIRGACLVSMLLAYRSLTDQELAEYVKFVESEAGQWYMSVMNSALLVAIDVAAAATASDLATAVPQVVGDHR